jgi:hypothetical protein
VTTPLVLIWHGCKRHGLDQTRCVTKLPAPQITKSSCGSEGGSQAAPSMVARNSYHHENDLRFGRPSACQSTRSWRRYATHVGNAGPGQCQGLRSKPSVILSTRVCQTRELDLMFYRGYIAFHITDRCIRIHTGNEATDKSEDTLTDLYERTWCNMVGPFEILYVNGESGPTNKNARARLLPMGIAIRARALEQHARHIERRGPQLQLQMHTTEDQLEREGVTICFRSLPSDCFFIGNALTCLEELYLQGRLRLERTLQSCPTGTSTRAIHCEREWARHAKSSWRCAAHSLCRCAPRISCSNCHGQCLAQTAGASQVPQPRPNSDLWSGPGLGDNDDQAELANGTGVTPLGSVQPPSEHRGGKYH